jgi:hypothetical protein
MARHRSVSSLNPQQEQALDGLRSLLRETYHDLRWHHRVGQLVQSFRGNGDRFAYGQGWMRRLSDQLKCSGTLLTKSLAFAEEFPNEREVGQLERIGISWSHLVASLTFPDRSQRLQLLREAASNEWTVARLRLEIRLRLEGPQHGGTGRPPREPHLDAPEVELEDLILRAKQWSRFLNTTWLAEGGVLEGLSGIDENSAENGLPTLLDRAVEALQEVGRRSQKVQKGLKEIRSKVQAS